MVVPSRPLTPTEWALVDDTLWGAAVFQFIGAYLGMVITSPFAWSKRDCPKARSAQNAEKGIHHVSSCHQKDLENNPRLLRSQS
eukprot:11125894-Heterocapsa_arctica.AAC.1